jgi:hypothetical protein
MSGMDALDILARFDAGQPITETELGYLLPKLERLGHTEKAYTTQHCCDRAVARMYRFRGDQVLWFAAQLGYAQSGVVKVPAWARIIPALMGGYIGTTTCRSCGRGWHFFRDAFTTITAISGHPPTFAKVV